MVIELENNADNIKIVLKHTSHPGNIGAIARAMKNMGLSKLILIKPKLFPSAEAYARASGAEDIIDNAVVVDTLDEALADCELILGCSARLRALSWPVLNPRESGEKIASYSCAGKVALLFGSEQSGLSNEDFEFCHYQCHIPTCENFASLNLSHAVQVFVYEIRIAMLKAQTIKPSSQKLANAEEIKFLMEHLMEYLSEIEFYHPKKSHILEHRLKRLIARVQLEKEELNVLRGILTATQKKYSQHEH